MYGFEALLKYCSIYTNQVSFIVVSVSNLIYCFWLFLHFTAAAVDWLLTQWAVAL